jgi:Putative zinc-finger
MSHLDEGLLAALVDDELDEAERLTVQAHLAECAECRRLLEEIKAFAAEADSLVATVEPPPRRLPVLVPVAAPGEVKPEAKRRLPWRTVAWAASVVLAAGLGWTASELHLGNPAPDLSDKVALTDRLAQSPDEPKATTPAPAPSAGPATGGRLGESDLRQAQPTRARERENNAPAAPRPAPTVTRDQAVPAAKRLESRMDEAAARDRGNTEAAPAANLSELAVTTSASAPSAPAAAGNVAAKSLQRPATNHLARREAGFRQVGMEEAVRTLGGSIRLVDGLEPERFLIGTTPIGNGTGSTSELVRVVYDDPPGRELWLDQERPVEEVSPFRARNSPALIAGDTVLSPGPGGSASLRWVDQHGFRLAFTGYLSGDSLRVLVGRVH